jgi:hypothetical protein
MMADENEDTSSEKPTEREVRKKLAPRDQHFCKLIAETGMGAVEAARLAFGWRCEPGSKENQKARNFARQPRFKKVIEELRAKRLAEEKAKESLRVDFGEIHKGDLREYAFKVLEKLRDNPRAKAADRFNAIKTLKKLHDPGKDINLVFKFIDMAWRYQKAHCPSCHTSFPLAKVKNPKLDEWRKRVGADPAVIQGIDDQFTRQMELIKRCDRRRTPHPGQKRLLVAPERHVVGEGAARAGKSYAIALFACLGLCLPGAEIWILAETYDRASKEVEYIKDFMNSIFFPYYKQMVSISHDKKTGEMLMTTKWGSSLRVKSSKSKGSITGHALELALCAEPGWLPADIYEELRARMSERLGRIIALGTPKGLQGFIGRMTTMHGRDPKTGRMIRWKREDRLIEKGCPWNVSMLITRMDPTDNPEYVKSELNAARMELTDEEYAQEFQGIGAAADGLKFGNVRDEHLREIDGAFWNRATYILGIDQGPKNFGTCLIGYDGDKIAVAWEFFNADERATMRKNLVKLYHRVPKWIERLGGNPENWKYTITDQDPPLDQIFMELEDEGIIWPTDIQKRHKNMARLNENWRRENQEFVNTVARKGDLLFHLYMLPHSDESESPGGNLLHDQVKNCIDIQDNVEKDTSQAQAKGWQTNDPFRGDHVLDAWYLAMWMIASNQVFVPKAIVTATNSTDPWAAQKAAFEQSMRQQDRRDRGVVDHSHMGEPRTPAEAWRRLINRQQNQGQFIGGYRGPYGNEA